MIATSGVRRTVPWAEFEDEWEDEALPWARSLASASGALPTPSLRRLGATAGRAALQGCAAGGGVARTAPIASMGVAGRAVSPAALMGHLSHAATAARSNAEAEAFIGALVPLAAQLLPHAAPAIMRAAPNLVRGLGRVTQMLRSNPATRPLVQAMPTIARRTAQSIASRSAAGQPVSVSDASRILARQTSRVLSSPQRTAAAYRQARALDQRYHRAVPAARPGPATPCRHCGR